MQHFLRNADRAGMMRFPSGLVVGILLAVFLGLARDAAAQDVCKADLQTWCPTATGTERARCLRQHRDQLSEQCRQAIGMMPHLAPGTGPAPLGDACGRDFARVCSTLSTESTRDVAVHCLTAHRDQLSPGCLAALSATPREDTAHGPRRHMGSRRRPASPWTDSDDGMEGLGR